MDQQQLPTSPGIGRRPRTGSRSFSLHSDKSGGGGHGRSNSKDTPATPGERAEKERRDSFLRGESKANPNAAVQELQPQARNVMEKVTLDSLRTGSYKDSSGNVIDEPDLSNPTRPRWERPLDTIRSFEKAIDGDYRRRSTYNRSTSDNDRDAYASRRSSYYGFNGNQSRYGGNGGYYGGQSDVGGAPPPPRARYSRGMSEGNMMGRYNNGHNVHSQYGPNNGSYDGSDSTGPWANSTDPSSQNSSFERLGNNGQGRSPEHNNYGLHDGYGPGPNAINEESDDYGYPPRPPTKNMNYGSPQGPPQAARKPIQLGGGGSSGGIPPQGGQLPSAVRVTPDKEKRQSWLGRRFSKNK